MNNFLKDGFIDPAKRALQSLGDKNVIESIKVNGVDQDVDNKAVNIKIPTKNSELENDSGYLTQYQDLTGYAKTEDVTKQVTEEISKIVAGAPEDFDTLKEMSDWISKHEDSAAAMNSNIQTNKSNIESLESNKVDKVTGKGLSTNDYTDADKSKLNGIAANANNYSHPTSDGNKHVPANGTSNGGKYLKATSTAGSYVWESLTKSDVTTALGYTPPATDTNTWRGIQNNLTSDSTTDSLSAAQGKLLKAEFDNIKNDLTAYANGTKAVAKATTADSATKATQDGNGNNIAQTYATKDEIPEPIDTSNFALKEKYGDTTINVGRKSGTTVGKCSTAEGRDTTASGNRSHAEGGYTTASGDHSHAEGFTTTASGNRSHAEGSGTTASGIYSHAEGMGVKASGYISHAEGFTTKTSGDYSHAEGSNTTALANQHAQGHYNNTTTATENVSSGTSTGTAFVIGNGTSSSESNAFRITGEGMIYATNATVQTGADYAEYFEWSDGNPNNEDRVGHFVTFDENDSEKIRYANNDDYILGIVSGMPNVIGNGDEDWKKRYILDDFGRYIIEEFEYEEVVGIDEETGENITEIKTGTKWKENPDYDNSKPYIQRKERPEWDAIGMLGVLSVYDDGTCKVNGYCRCGKNGIATSSNSGYRVIARITNDVVKVVFR